MQRPCAQDLYKIKSKKTKALFYISAKKKKKKILTNNPWNAICPKKKYGIKIAKETILSAHKKTITPFSFEFPKNYIVITKS